MDSKSQLLVGVHVALGSMFVGFGVIGLLEGAGPIAAGLRVLMGVLIIGLGVAVARWN